MSSSSLKIVLKNGVIGSTERQKQTVLGLGLKYRHATRNVKDTPAIRGMISKVRHLVEVVKHESKPSQLSLVPEYELGSVSEKILKPKKVSKKPVAAETSDEKPSKQESKKPKSDSRKEKVVHTKKEKTKSVKSEKVTAKKSVKKVKKS